MHLSRRAAAGTGCATRSPTSPRYVRPGGALEAETWRRGQTVYLPDGAGPAAPAGAQRGRGQPAARTSTAAGGACGPSTSTPTARPPRVRAGAGAGAQPGQARLRRRAGGVRRRDARRSRSRCCPSSARCSSTRALARGAINLPLPGAGGRAATATAGGWCCARRSPVEEHNAQISLLTGDGRGRHHARRAGSGCCAPCPRRAPEAVAGCAPPPRALGVAWPAGRHGRRGGGRASTRVAPRGAAFLDHAAELLRGAALHGVRRRYAPARPATAASARRTRTSRRRCAGSPTGTRPRCAWRCTQRPRRCPSGCATPCRGCPTVMASDRPAGSAADRGAVDLAEAVLLAGPGGRGVRRGRASTWTSRGRSAGTVAVDDPPVRGALRGATCRCGERDPGAAARSPTRPPGPCSSSWTGPRAVAGRRRRSAGSRGCR